MAKQKRFVIYTRVSTEEQAKGTSLDVQAEACKELISPDQGDVLVAVTSDPGVSGANFNRPGLQEALQLIKSGNANVLACYDLSRLSRKVEHQQKIRRLVLEVGGELDFVRGKYENNSSGKIMYGVTGILAEVERDEQNIKSWENRVAVVKSGVQTQRSVAPFGFKVVNSHDAIREPKKYTKSDYGRYEIVEEQAEIVRLIFNLYKEGNSLRAICRILQDRGIETPKGMQTRSKTQQKVWLSSTIKTIMSNPCHIGKATFGKTKTIRDESLQDDGYKRPFKRVRVDPSEWIYIDCPPIIDKALFDYCNDQMKKAQTRFAGPTERKYMLTGILYCAKCDRTMMANYRKRAYHPEGEKEWLYRCKNSARITIMGDFVCNRHVFKGHIVEPQIANVLAEVGANPAWIVQAYDNFQDKLDNEYTEASYEALQKQLARLDETEEATIELQIESRVARRSTGLYDKKLTEIAQARAGLKAKLDRFDEFFSTALEREDVSEQADDLVDALGAIQATLTASELPNFKKHAIVSTVIEKITGDEQGKLVVTFRPFSPTTKLIALVDGEDIKVEFVEHENFIN